MCDVVASQSGLERVLAADSIKHNIWYIVFDLFTVHLPYLDVWESSAMNQKVTRSCETGDLTETALVGWNCHITHSLWGG